MIALWMLFVLSVTDGDTFRGRVALWPEQTIETAIRIAGIDTPELQGKCIQEKQRASQAREALTTLLKGRVVYLSEVQSDKYGGRYLARVQLNDGTDVAAKMIGEGYAVAYKGRGPKHDWCKE